VRRAALVGVAVLLASALPVWLFLPSGGKGPSAGRSSSVRQGAAVVAATEPEARSSTDSEEPSAPVASAVARAAGSVSASPKAAPAPKRRERVVSRLNEKLAAEPVDPRWTREVRGTVDELLRRVAFERSTVQSATCGASMCKVEVDHENEFALREFIDSASEMTRASGAGGMAYRDRDSDGALRTVVYVARPGADLPRVF
jgi:hypothetical protein